MLLDLDFITGFPGESESQFNELIDFLKEAQLDRVGCFPYSDVDGAAANNYLNPVDEELREERCGILMQVQSEISKAKLTKRIGKEYQVLIDYVDDEGNAVGRSKYEAPDIDGVITIANTRGIKPGDMVRARITASSEHDLEAELIGSTESSINFKQA